MLSNDEVSSWSMPAAPIMRTEQAQSTAVSIVFIMLTTLFFHDHVERVRSVGRWTSRIRARVGVVSGC